MTKIQRIVYVIDDDASIRKSLSRLLRSADFDAETFSSTEDFLSGSREEKNACIVADIRMPETTGFDLAESLSAKHIHIPLIFISASNDNQTRQRARELGAVAFFQKPVDDQALLDAVLWAISESYSSTRNDHK